MTGKAIGRGQKMIAKEGGGGGWREIQSACTSGGESELGRDYQKGETGGGFIIKGGEEPRGKGI